MADTAPVISPTGAPVIDPAKVPWLVAIVGAMVTIGGAIASAPEMGLILPAAILVIGKILLGLGTVGGSLLGVVSPGWRKPAPVVPPATGADAAKAATAPVSP